MAFKKVSKEEWLKMSQEERDYLTLEFNKSVEKRKRTFVIITRAIALILVFALIFIGYSQLQAVSTGYSKVMDQYGAQGFCYLCGMNTLKSCGCQNLDPQDILNSTKRAQIANETAIRNANETICKFTKDIYWSKDGWKSPSDTLDSMPLLNSSNL